MEGHIELNPEVAFDLLTMFIEAYVLDGDEEALELARSFRGDDGSAPPIDEMVADYRLLLENELQIKNDPSCLRHMWE